MRRVLLLLAVAASMAACSSQPTNPQSEPAPVEAASVPAPAPAATADTAVPAPAEKPAAKASTGGKIPSGYRLEKRNGKELYCRSVTLSGSRFAEKTCFTREQLEEIADRTDSAIGDLEQGMKVCTGSEGCGQN